MTKHDQTNLALMFEACRAKPNYKAQWLCGSYGSATRILDYATDLVQTGEIIAWFEGVIEFPNGSKIIVTCDSP